MHFSVNDLLNFNKCERLLFLNSFGDKALQTPPTDFMKKLWQMGRKYEANVTDFFEYEKPKYKVGDHKTGLEETIKLMEKGTEAIYQGVLKNDDLVGIPDFLIKCKSGKSVFGDYYYYPVDVKSATISRERYLFQLACYAYLLGEIQHFAPMYGSLLLLDLDLNVKFFPELMPKVISALEGAKKILSAPDTIPNLFIDSYCPNCQWYSFCSKEASEKKDLSLMPGIHREHKKKLLEIEVKDYTDLAKCNIEDIEHLKGFGKEKSEQILIQAKCLTENKIYLKAIPELPLTDKEIYFDFESDFTFNESGKDFNRIDYLVGVLEKTDTDYKYSHLILEDERTFLQSLGNYFESHKDYIFYHYGTYEHTVLNGKWNELPKVELFNVEKVIKDSFILPTTNYSLKSVAKLIGFSWSNKHSSAMQSMCWYSQYLETKDKKYLDLSIEYNEDDTRALLAVVQWIRKIKDSNTDIGFINNVELG